jgi:trehalose 6-phosphate synthase complex regulatory subunit
MKAKMSATEADEAPVDFLMVAGDGRDDEIVFRWANDLGETGSVKNVTTVSLGSRDTQAMKTLTQGVTGKSFDLPLLKRSIRSES